MNTSNLGLVYLLRLGLIRLGIFKHKKRSLRAVNPRHSYSQPIKISIWSHLVTHFFIFVGLISACIVALLAPVFFFPGTFAAEAANQTIKTVNPQGIMPVVSSATDLIDNIGNQTAQLIKAVSQPSIATVTPVETTPKENIATPTKKDNGEVDTDITPDFVLNTFADSLNPLVNTPREVLLPDTLTLNTDAVSIPQSTEVKTEIAVAPTPAPTQALRPVVKVQPAAPATIQIPANLPASDFIWPIRGSLSQGFTAYHPGIDVPNPFGSPVYAANDGVVQVANYDGYGLGKHIVIAHANSYTTTYAHLDIMLVSPGQNVAKGALIGRVGLTGRTTGPHLHFEIRKNGAALNPLNFLH